jgi:hypothetical protein
MPVRLDFTLLNFTLIQLLLTMKSRRRGQWPQSGSCAGFTAVDGFRFESGFASDVDELNPAVLRVQQLIGSENGCGSAQGTEEGPLVHRQRLLSHRRYAGQWKIPNDFVFQY